jgi:RNA polymerase sigma-70 factor (ECF subfamily)
MTDGSPVISIRDLVARHHAEVYRFAYRLSGTVADAEDLSQQAFLIAHQKLHQLRDASDGRAWLFTITRNCFWRNCQRKRPVAAADLELDVGDIVDASDDDTLDPFDSEQLQAALNELPEEFRVVVAMFYFEELSYREIAESLKLPQGTVMSRLSRAKRRLREMLSPKRTSKR